jgi:hypothetical protein
VVLICSSSPCVKTRYLRAQSSDCTELLDPQSQSRGVWWHPECLWPNSCKCSSELRLTTSLRTWTSHSRGRVCGLLRNCARPGLNSVQACVGCDRWRPWRGAMGFGNATVRPQPRQWLQAWQQRTQLRAHATSPANAPHQAPCNLT